MVGFRHKMKNFTSPDLLTTVISACFKTYYSLYKVEVDFMASVGCKVENNCDFLSRFSALMTFIIDVCRQTFWFGLNGTAY